MDRPIIAAAALLREPSFVVLDLRDETAYRQGHWPAAMHLDIKVWEAQARTPAGSLENAEAWEEHIGALGIDGSRAVVVYDDGRMTEAARAWFILQWHGVDVRVLDGGWPALQRAAPERVEQVPAASTPAVYRQSAGQAPRVGLLDRHTLHSQLSSGVQVLDARSQAEHLGEDLRANARGGHLPGAKWLAHGKLLNADGTLRPAEELRAQLTDAGIAGDAPVVTHCDAGGRAALAALAAVAAGQREVSAYYLSFSDWAADGSCPVVKP